MAMVGVAVVGGDVLYTLGSQAFLGGIDYVASLIGLYCVPVIIDLVATKDPHLKVTGGADGIRFREAAGICWRQKFNVARSSVIGTVIGILPGAGGSIAGPVSYPEARRSSPPPAPFGKGEPAGATPPRAANKHTPGGADGIRFREAAGICWRQKFNVARSSVIGTVIGILPGAGGSIAGLVSYSEARRSSPRSAHFGKGEPDGVIATEAANNATVGGGFIPTLVLGIPGTPPDAIILGALLVQGIKIGPPLFASEGHIVYTFIYGLLIATILMLPAGLLIGRYAYKSVIAFPKALLVPPVAFLTEIGRAHV